MFKIRYVSEADQVFWLKLDKYIREEELLLKIRDRRGYIIFDDHRPIGVMRYNLFWDSILFLTFIFLESDYRGNGFGRMAMLSWESEMREFGYKMVMTSTQVDEQAQHFYRKLGYIEKGSLFFDHIPFEQPLEMMMLKNFD